VRNSTAPAYSRVLPFDAIQVKFLGADGAAPMVSLATYLGRRFAGFARGAAKILFILGVAEDFLQPPQEIP